MPVEHRTAIGSDTWGRGYLVRASMQSLDEVSVPLVIGLRKRHFVAQDQLDAFEEKALDAYEVIFSHVRDRLGLATLPDRLNG